MRSFVKRIARQAVIKALDVRFGTGRGTMLFVFGHMRSGSSLLVHILNTNPDIIGYGETHFPYRRPIDFARSAFLICRSFSRVWPRERYVLDKVLGRKLGPSPDLLLSRSSRTILLVRRPEDTLPSILGLGLENQATPRTALDNYLERLEDVQRIAERVPADRWCYVRYEDIVSSSTATLAELTAFLGLDEPLRTEYELIWSTGKRRIGDPSPRITAGRIIPTKTRYPHEVPAAIMEEARQAFQECLNVLELRSLGRPGLGYQRGSSEGGGNPPEIG